MEENCEKRGKSFGSKEALEQHREDYDHNENRETFGVNISLDWKHIAGVVLVLLAVLAGSFFAFREPESPIDGIIAEADSEMVAYYDPNCGCCAEHADILSHDYDLKREITSVENLHSMKEDLGIPRFLWSCHTTIVNGYFVEGHMPDEAIQNLLEQEPDIDGIALPGMPDGSPGMPGEKTEDWTIYSLENGEASEFMVI